MPRMKRKQRRISPNDRTSIMCIPSSPPFASFGERLRIGDATSSITKLKQRTHPSIASDLKWELALRDGVMDSVRRIALAMSGLPMGSKVIR